MAYQRDGIIIRVDEYGVITMMPRLSSFIMPIVPQVKKAKVSPAPVPLTVVIFANGVVLPSSVEQLRGAIVAPPNASATSVGKHRPCTATEITIAIVVVSRN